VSSHDLEGIVGTVLVCVGTAVAFGLVAAYLVWVIQGREK
jgi:hypothetical protein